jgi:hypothetical protein
VRLKCDRNAISVDDRYAGFIGLGLAGITSMMRCLRPFKSIVGSTAQRRFSERLTYGQELVLSPLFPVFNPAWSKLSGVYDFVALARPCLEGFCPLLLQCSKLGGKIPFVQASFAETLLAAAKQQGVRLENTRSA